MPKKRNPYSRKPSLASKLASTLRDRAAERKLFAGDSSLSKTQRLKSGLRPRNPSKKDVWAALTLSERMRILARSQEHITRQEIMGVPADQMYGPALVLEGKVRWDDKITSSTLGN